MRRFTAHWLGRVRYAEAHALQERLLEARVRGDIGDTLLLLEHEPVDHARAGRAAARTCSSPRDRLESLGVDLHETGRGGDVTYHGPGQLVAYPIFDLKPDRLRRAPLRARPRARDDRPRARAGRSPPASSRGTRSSSASGSTRRAQARWPGDPREPGGAMRPAKIGAIGVRISRWVTMHGFAFNVSTDLAGFGLIVPCGIAAVRRHVAGRARGRGARRGCRSARRGRAASSECSRRRDSGPRPTTP